MKFFVNQEYTEEFTVTPEIVAEFARVSGDFNPIHIDAEFAKSTPFGRPIAHGLLGLTFLSGIAGTKFPGPGSVLLGMNTRFAHPVFVGDPLLIKLSINSIRDDKPIATIDFQATSEKRICFGGQMTLKLPT